MGRLAVRSVRYSGDNWKFELKDIPNGLVVIEGPNRSGKSTFSDMIYFALGGTVEKFRQAGSHKHKEISEDTNNYVQLEIEVNGERFRVTRYFHESADIAVESGGKVNVYPVQRRGDAKTFSDWLLDKLEIERVTYSHGAHSFSLNVPELFRLVYHDQEPDPGSVFKRPDVANFITDSRALRKAIFENLMGRAHQDYYKALATFKKTEKEKNSTEATLKAFNAAVQFLNENKDEVNLIFLKKMLAEKEDQLSRQEAFRATLKARPPLQAGTKEAVASLKEKILEGELELSGLRQKEQVLFDDLRRMNSARREIELEINQVSKIVFSHHQLDLFSPDTCPYCLRKIERVHNHCICGSEVDEGSYQRYFYNPSEYLEIIASKRKNLSTLEEATKSFSDELQDVQSKHNEQRKVIEGYSGKLNRLVEDAGLSVDTERLSEIDDEILKTRTELQALNQGIQIEKNREGLQRSYNQVLEKYSADQKSLQALEIKSQQAMTSLRREFNQIYEEMLKATVQSVLTAKIDDDYVPEINNGEYREVSARVPIRLSYYLTLLKLSLDNDKIIFPKFLLIDTPNTAGIDKNNLLASLEKIKDVMPLGADSPAQVILTTGADDIPKEFDQYAVLRMSNEERLLKSRRLEELEKF